MADGSQGGLSGVLFEAGKTISDAGKQQAQQTVQSAFTSLTGSQKQLFSNPQNQGTTLPKQPPGQLPKFDPNKLGSMFEGLGGKPGFGTKKPPIPAPAQISQEELQRMASENEARDAEEIAKREAELQQIKQQTMQAHKSLHDEVYYNRIQNIGVGTMQQEREAKAKEEEQEALAKQQEETAKQMEALPGTPLFQGQQLGQPVNIAKQQAMTKTEVNRGSNG